MKDKKKPFKYHKRPADSFQKQAERSSGAWDRVLKDGLKEFRPKDGDHKIRLMPPTFEGAKHYAMEIYVHKNVGPDNQNYLCLYKMKQEPCPVCEEYRVAQSEGNDKYASKIRVSERRLAWIIDRKNEKEGPQLYNMPFPKHEKRICAVARDPDTGETLYLDDPDEGYDVLFRRETIGDFPEYTNHQASRKQSPLSRDEDTQAEWLEYIQEHPLDTVLQFFDYDHIKACFSGAVSKKEDAEDDDDGPSTRNGASKRDGEHAKARRELAERIDKRGSSKPKDDDEDEDDDDDEEEERPAAKGKGKRIEEPEDEDTDEDEDEPTRSGKSKRGDDDTDDDEDPPRSSAKSRTRATAEDDDDEDEEDEPASRKGKAKASADDDDEDDDEPPARGKKSARTEAEDEDDDDDEDEPVRGSSRKASSKSEDEDDEPEPSSRRERIREGLKKAKL